MYKEQMELLGPMHDFIKENIVSRCVSSAEISGFCFVLIIIIIIVDSSKAHIPSCRMLMALFGLTILDMYNN